ncbi:uncharacterized protein LOC123895912 [Trifolium pratense]|nr:uncharacterized protein LOC123895912 [Trifolium pratense]
MHWLKEGDLNTKNFHMSASLRQRAKKIGKLVNDENVASQSFNARSGLSLITPKITQEDNAQLVRPITLEELKEALFQMHPDKAPGPDGFNPAFYQHFWIYVAMMCSRQQQIGWKEGTSRLKSYLDKCVSEEQSAFIEGRSILDNALIAIEVILALKRRTRGWKGELALKIDISKAYDKVDWGFMCGMLKRLGFSAKWIHWMMICVSSVNYSVLVNFEKVGPIFPGRGLRQGDPLSPYLFILITEGLYSLIKRSLASGDLHGVQICHGAPMVSHLLFADDCFLFCRSTVAEINHLMGLLKTYEEASGQEINLTKSEVFFSRNLSIAAQEDLSKIMGVRHVLGTGNYLGLPSMIGRKKKEVFAFIKDKIWKRINSWRGRQLSRAGKEIMIKSVLQSIPTYIMSVYLLPDSTIRDIERMMNFFWWGGGANNKGIRWLAWDRMTHPKAHGGIGFRDLHTFNLAMIAKQGWNIMTKPNTLLAKLYKADIFRTPLFLSQNWVIILAMLGEIIWIDNTHGQYSFNSGYKLLLNVTGKVDIGSQQEDWHSLWTILAPRKTKHLLWRISKGCLPTRMRLQERRVPCPLLCPLCNHQNEDDWHVLFGCDASIQARQAAGIVQFLEPFLLQASSAKDAIHAICSTNDKQATGLFAALAWVLWNNRNSEVWNDSHESGRTLGFKARHMWEDWLTVQQLQHDTEAANTQHDRRNNTQQQQALRWQKPAVGWYKCNVDAGFHKALNKTSFGWCLRDDRGSFVMAATAWLEGNCSIVEGESIALLEALRTLEQRGLSHVVIETDSKSVVDAISNLRGGNSEFSSIVFNINKIMLCNPNFKVKFIKQQANMVAHTLARAAMFWTSRCIFETLPLLSLLY